MGLHQHPERQPAPAPQGTPRHEGTPRAQAEQRRADGLVLRTEAQRIPTLPVTNELPEEFYFKSNIMVTNRHESSSRASGEAH